MADEYRPWPVGSPEDLKSLGLNPALNGSCSEPVQGKNEGCPFWASCKYGRQGPENYAVRVIIAENNSARESVLPCYDAMRLDRDMNDNPFSEDFMEIVTDEKHPKGGPGTIYMLKGTAPVSYTENGKVVTVHEDKVWPIEVPALKKGKDDKRLLQQSYSQLVKERRKGERLVKRAQKALVEPEEDEIDREIEEAGALQPTEPMPERGGSPLGRRMRREAGNAP